MAALSGFRSSAADYPCCLILGPSRSGFRPTLWLRQVTRAFQQFSRFRLGEAYAKPSIISCSIMRLARAEMSSNELLLPAIIAGGRVISARLLQFTILQGRTVS